MARLLIFLTLVVFIVTLVNQGSAQKRRASARDQTVRWVHYGPAIVELRGRLIVRTYFGPPNYGENPRTDSKEGAWIVLLSRPINVREQGNDPTNALERNVRRVQLVLFESEKQKSAHRLVGKSVVIRGTLFHGYTGHHRTDVLMEVQSIRGARSN